MYAHGYVFDAKPDEGEPRTIEVGNPVEAVANDAAAAIRDGRPQRYFASKEAFDGATAREQARAEAKAAAEQAEANRVAAEKQAADDRAELERLRAAQAQPDAVVETEDRT